MLLDHPLSPFLHKVQTPSQCVGGEDGHIQKDRESVEFGLEDGCLKREHQKALKDRLSPPCGKPKGAFVRATNMQDAENESRPLVCLAIEPGLSLRARFRYQKLGRIVYSGHLGLVRLWPRILSRSGLPVAYARGYRPKPDLTFGPALALGIASLDEYLDRRLRVRELPRIRSIGMGEDGDALAKASLRGNLSPVSMRLRYTQIQARVGAAQAKAESTIASSSLSSSVR
ncbi:MAG: TIGR03936 family radical SAM-associated protein [Myxococcota bacterium]